MERLTQSNFNYCKEYCAEADGCAYAKGVIPDMCGDAAQYYRLAAYEDTGLTPEEAAYFGRLVRGERLVTEEDLVESGVSQEEIQRMKDVITAEAEGRLLVLDTQEEDAYPGLKQKYIVLKADTGNPVENCFVLRPHKDPAAVKALRAYAAATENRELSEDIYNWVGKPVSDSEQGDYIGREEIIKRIRSTKWPDYIKDVLIEEVTLIPAANVRPVVRGKWVWDGDTLDWEKRYFCNRCEWKTYKRSDFCPNCGAKMEEKHP